MTDVAFASALEQARLVRDGDISPAELVELYLGRIDAIDTQLNAFVTLDADGARAQARDPRPGPFSGVPLPIKDLNETAGLRTTYSTKAYADRVPDFDVAAVRRLREAGFVFLGKTNTPELGSLPVTESELNGVCRNPWDLSRTPGGSSGGGAAAVAAGLSPVAHASDGGGSIRIPSACCGLFGLKPSRGRVSPAPWGAGVLGLSTQGAITRTVRDSAALLDVMSGYEPGDAFVPAPPATSFLDAADRTPARCRFALALEPPVDVPLDPTCAGPATALADLLTELGHERIEGAPPWEDVRAEFLNVWRMGPAVSGVEPDVLEPINRALAEDALATSSAELGRAVVRLQGYARTIVAFWNDVDVVVTPTLAQPPVPIGWHFEAEDPREQFDRAYLFTPYTATVNVTGQPAASVPFTTGPDGLPRGVQLIGKPLREEQLLSLCAQIEEARPWRDRTPPLAKLG